MIAYPKIPTAWKRDPETNYKTLIEGVWATDEIELLHDVQWTFTEKIDGENIRVIFSGGQIVYKGRHDTSDLRKTSREALDRIFSGKTRLFEEAFGSNEVCFYGEAYGGNIQKAGKHYRKEASFILFDVLVNEHLWYSRDEVEHVGDVLGIDVVPIIDTGNLDYMIRMVRNGFYSQIAEDNMIAEGVVARPAVMLLKRNGNQIITKIKHKDFELC